MVRLNEVENRPINRRLAREWKQFLCAAQEFCEVLARNAFNDQTPEESCGATLNGQGVKLKLSAAPTTPCFSLGVRSLTEETTRLRSQTSEGHQHFSDSR